MSGQMLWGEWRWETSVVTKSPPAGRTWRRPCGVDRGPEGGRDMDDRSKSSRASARSPSSPSESRGRHLPCLFPLPDPGRVYPPRRPHRRFVAGQLLPLVGNLGPGRGCANTSSRPDHQIFFAVGDQDGTFLRARLLGERPRRLGAEQAGVDPGTHRQPALLSGGLGGGYSLCGGSGLLCPFFHRPG